MTKIKKSNNILAKILALVVAVVLWILVMNDQNPTKETVFEVPLEVKNLQTGLLVSNVPEMVKLKIKGTRIAIGSLKTEDLKAFINLSGVAVGHINAKVNASLPNGFELISIMPEKLDLTLENTTYRQMKVEAKLSGKIAPGVAIGKIKVSPEMVRVEGLEKNINEVEKVVAWFDMSDKNATFALEIPLIPMDKDGKVVENVTISPKNIQGEVLLTSGLEAKELEIKPTLDGFLRQDLVIKNIIIKPEKIDIQGDKETLSKIDYIFTLPINLNLLKETSTIETDLQLPNGVFWEKKKVQVNIVIEGKK